MRQRIGPIFVVGYSRSGTKFICNLLEQASNGRIEHLGELHFFGRLSTTVDESVNQDQIQPMLRKLAEQYARRKACPYTTVDAILACFSVAEVNPPLRTRMDVFRYFLDVIARDRGVELVCDGTPRNAYYLREILDAFPTARIIYMIRDPRDSILSQKQKSRQVWVRGDRREALRLALNYNPVIMARFWVSSIRRLEQHKADPRILPLPYEQMLGNPVTTLLKVSEFVDCDGLEQLSGLVRTGNGGKYRVGLSHGEIAAVETILGEHLERHHYRSFVPSWLGLIYVPLWIARFVVTAPFVYLMNLGRFSNIAHEIRKRILH